MKIKSKVDIISQDGFDTMTMPEYKYLRIRPLNSEDSWTYCEPEMFVLHGWKEDAL
jgi:hypothetical protein